MPPPCVRRSSEHRDSGGYACLQEREAEEQNWSAAVLDTLHLPNPMELDVPRTPGDYITQPFKRNHLDRCALHRKPSWHSWSD